ncbi:hypothetical protein ACFV3R_04795 [Streptomyces sp. NPDC059740]|uniref:hypothetical protein n=1 Tax=Streptomyces sp. NPDC059740 TaxID=3346926 RepID=UPI0036605521
MSNYSGNERQIGDEELMDVAQDPEQARRLRKALQTLATNPNVGGRIKEMAQEVLSGHIGMKDAIQDPRYMDALGERMTEIRRKAEDMTSQEREEAREKAAAWMRAQEAEEDKERAELDGPSLNIVTGRRGGRGGVSHRG